RPPPDHRLRVSYSSRPNASGESARMTRAGFPAAITSEGISRVTTISRNIAHARLCDEGPFLIPRIGMALFSSAHKKKRWPIPFIRLHLALSFGRGIV